MDSETTVRYRVRYSGRVQGVGFRMTTVSLADGLNVNGTVRNEHDGTVTLDVEGPKDQLDRLMKRIERAMSNNIQSADVDELPPKGHTDGLRITY